MVYVDLGSFFDEVQSPPLKQTPTDTITCGVNLGRD